MKKLLTLVLVLVCSVSWGAGTTVETSGKSTVQTGSAIFTVPVSVATPTADTHAVNQGHLALRFSAGYNGSGIATITTNIPASRRNFLTFQAASTTNNGYSGNYGGLIVPYDGTYQPQFYSTTTNGLCVAALATVDGYVAIVFTFSGATSGNVQAFFRTSSW